MSFRCVIHGSFRKHFEEIKKAHAVFTAAGIEVLAPSYADIKSFKNGFAILASDKSEDPRMVELLYLHNLKRLSESGFSYFVNPEGYIGKSASYELGIAQVSNVRCFFLAKPGDHPAYVHKNSIFTPENLAEYISKHNKLPDPQIKRNEKMIHKLWEDLMVPGSIVAGGAIIEYDPPTPVKEKEVLLVQTHKWGGKFSIIGGKIRRNEGLNDGIAREIKEETGLRANIGRHIATFDQIQNSGYYLPGIQHIFVDKIAKVGKKFVRLNEEAQNYLWIPAQIALKELDIEPNARHTLELYSSLR